MSQPLLSITNQHHPSCGTPPHIAPDPDTYVGYFENPFGEQWVFTYHRPTKRGVLRGGDIDWENPQTVEDGQVADLMLGQEESQWLAACWASATGTMLAGQWPPLPTGR